MISKSTRFYYLIQQSSLTSTSMSCHTASLQNYKNEISENVFAVSRRITIYAKIGSSRFMSQITISYIYRRPLPIIFIEISSKKIKVGVGFIMAQWYTSNVFESSLNNIRLFFSIPSNSNRIIRSFILKEKQVLVQAYCFLACAGPVENLL